MTTNRKKYVMIFFLTLTTLCYSLPYLSSSFYTQFLEAFSLSNTQAGFLMSMFSLTATPGYLFGGIIADKFSPKKVIMLSQLLTAALGYAMCLIQGYSILLVCYLGFGISTTFLHWSAYLKLVRAQANENEEGKIFGFFETCAAVVGAVTSYGILGLLGHISSFRMVTAIYASILVVVTIIIGLTLEDPKNEQASNEFNVRMVGKALAHPVTWINGFIVMGLFILATGTSYLNPYLCSVFGTSVEFGTALAIANRTVIRIFVVGIGGLLLDRWKTPKFLIVCSLSLAVITGAVPSASKSLHDGCRRCFGHPANLHCHYCPPRHVYPHSRSQGSHGDHRHRHGHHLRRGLFHRPVAVHLVRQLAGRLRQRGLPEHPSSLSGGPGCGRGLRLPAAPL